MLDFVTTLMAFVVYDKIRYSIVGDLVHEARGEWYYSDEELEISDQTVSRIEKQYGWGYPLAEILALEVSPGVVIGYVRQQINDEKYRQKWAEAEEEEALDLFEFLGVDHTTGFRFSEYRTGEEKILKPMLEKEGLQKIHFYTMEGDSFGPLVRGCRATTKDGKGVVFVYG